MHGNRSNIILFHAGIVIEIFKNNIPEDESLSLNDLDRSIDWSYENFVQHHNQPEALYFTFGKIVWKYLKIKDYENLSAEEQWQAIQQVRDELVNPVYSIREADGKIFFSLLDFGKLIRKFDDPVRAIT